MQNKLEITDKDKKILNILIKDGKASLKAIAKEIGSNIDYVHRRIRFLISEGVIKRFTVALDHIKLGFPYLSYNALTLTNISAERYDALISYLANKKQVSEIAPLTGGYDISVSVVSRDAQDLNNFILETRQKFKDIIQAWDTYPVLKFFDTNFQL